MNRDSNYANFLGRNNVLVNVDKDGHAAYIKARENLVKQKEQLNQINTMNEDLESLKNEITEIKQLLLKVLEKNK